MQIVENRFWVEPGSKTLLKDHDPSDTREWTKKSALKALLPLRRQLNELQQLLYATEKHGLLVVLQGMDTGGKDGVIKHVMSAFNPQGCQVSSFKVPSKDELAHDFLWRVHKVTPRRGMVGIFNRSHYEDVLVVRVNSLVPKAVWRRRYEAINEFEEILAESGVIVLKFFLHISKEEQKERLSDRLADPTEHWKFRAGDLDARARWNDYTVAYEEAINRCSTKHAPWYIIPADKKWYRNLLVSQILVKTLQSLEMEWPHLESEAEGIEIV